MRFHVLNTSTMVLACATLAACADSTNPAAGRPVSVSFSTAPSAGSSMSFSPDAGPSRSVSVVSGANTLVITRAQIVVSRIELERAGAICASSAAAGDDSPDEHECAELALEPALIDLPVDATVVGALNVSVPEGSYSSLETKIRPVQTGSSNGRGSTAFLAAHPDFAGVSIRVDGTYNGKPFTYIGAPETGFETSFSPPLAVTTSAVNLTVHVDVSSWFRNAAGLIDPSTANAGGANAAVVSDNIKRSFKAFHDDDRNGRDDSSNTI